MAKQVYFLNTGIASSENVLISLLKNKDELSYNYLYDNYSAPLYGLILRIVENEDLANAALIETFSTIWLKINEYDNRKSRLFIWMLNIAKKAAAQKAGITLEEEPSIIFA